MMERVEFELPYTSRYDTGFSKPIGLGRGFKSSFRPRHALYSGKLRYYFEFNFNNCRTKTS